MAIKPRPEPTPGEAPVNGENAAVEQIATLLRLSAALSGALSEEEVSTIVLGKALPALGAAAGDVVLLEEGGAEFRALCWMGYPEELVRPWMRYPVSSGTPSGDVVRSGEPVFLQSAEEWEQRYPRIAPIIRSASLGASASLPLVAAGQVRGTLNINFSDPRSFPERERTMLLALAGQCALALERARLFEAEQHAREEAESANRAKSDFLTVMSHELRTPLTAILGYEELLADGVSGPVTPLQQQQLDRIKLSALHLLGLIEELLTFSGLEAGRETVHPIAIDVGALLDEAAALTAPLAATRELALTVDKPPHPISLMTDRGKLRQVLASLLSNAVKFTRRGSISLRAWQAGDDVTFEVRDTGIGISPEHLGRIFEPFWQAEHPPTRRIGGTGLGLGISRSLVQLLGGTIEVASELGAGSVFRVIVPKG